MKAVLISGILLVTGFANASQFSGSWVGQYHVNPQYGQEEISAVTLKIVETSPSKIQAIFYFHDVPVPENIENINPTAGCFSMAGSINPKTNKLTLTSTGWMGGKSFSNFVNGNTGKPAKWTESLTAAVTGNSLAGRGIRDIVNKSPTSFDFTKADDSKAQLPTRCEIGAALPTLTTPSEATIGFMNAMQSGNYDVMEIYLQKGADINCKNCSVKSMTLDTQTSPLLNAIGGAGKESVYGVLRMVKWLIEHKADVNQADAYGRTPVLNATRWTQIAFGAEFNSKGSSLGDYQLLQYLLSVGGKIGVRDMSLNNAISTLFPSASSIGLGFQSEGYIKTINQLVPAGENINQQNQYGDTPLISATRNCADAVVPTILSLGGDPSIQNALGKSALDIALQKAQSNVRYCNTVLKQLSNAKPSRVAQSSNTRVAADQQGASAYADTYAGTFNGSDTGIFEAKISQDGSIALNARSNQSQRPFTGTGKVASDGTVTIGTINTGTTFTGSIDAAGVLSGIWKNTQYNLAGSFEGKKSATNPSAARNGLDTVGDVLSVFNSILKPR